MMFGTLSDVKGGERVRVGEVSPSYDVRTLVDICLSDVMRYLADLR